MDGNKRITDSIKINRPGYNIESITKKHIPSVFQLFVFPVYLQNRLSYKTSVYIFLHHFLKSFQLEQTFFKSGDKISWFVQKRYFANKKLPVRKNPPFWKIQ